MSSGVDSKIVQAASSQAIQQIESNMASTLQKIIDFTTYQTVALQGAILGKHFDQSSKTVTLRAADTVVGPSLVHKSKFIALLNLRRVLNTIQGVSEDYVDRLMNYEQFAHFDASRLDLLDLLSLSCNNKYFETMQVDEAMLKVLSKMTVDGLVKFSLERQKKSIRDAIFGDETKSSGSDLNEGFKRDNKKLVEGIKKYSDVVKDAQETSRKMELLKQSMEMRERHNESMSKNLLKDVVQLRETVGRVQQVHKVNYEYTSADEVFRVDYFTVKDLGDETLVKLLNERIKRVEVMFRNKYARLTRIKTLDSELQAAQLKVRDMEEQLSSKNPAYASILVKKMISLLGSDRHMVWKVIQENFGKEWFHSVFLDRSLNHKYNIDYEAIDQLVPKLNRIVVKNSPNDIAKLLTDSNSLLLNILIETFQQQKEDLEREVMRGHDRELQSHNVSQAKPQSGFEADAGDQSQNGDHNSYTASRHLEEAKRKNFMLLNEIRNLKAEKVNLSQSLLAQNSQLKLVEGFMMELADTAGIPKEGFSLVQQIGKSKKLDQKLLMKNGFAKVVAQGKVELVARLNIVVGSAQQASMNPGNYVTKSTNTDSAEYNDTAAQDPDIFNEVTKAAKIRQKFRESVSNVSSNSKKSKMSRIYSTLREKETKKFLPPKSIKEEIPVEMKSMIENRRKSIKSLIEEQQKELDSQDGPAAGEEVLGSQRSKKKNFRQLEEAAAANGVGKRSPATKKQPGITKSMIEGSPKEKKFLHPKDSPRKRMISLEKDFEIELNNSMNLTEEEHLSKKSKTTPHKIKIKQTKPSKPPEELAAMEPISEHGESRPTLEKIDQHPGRAKRLEMQTRSTKKKHELLSSNERVVSPRASYSSLVLEFELLNGIQIVANKAKTILNQAMPEPESRMSLTNKSYSKLHEQAISEAQPRKRNRKVDSLVHEKSGAKEESLDSPGRSIRVGLDEINSKLSPAKQFKTFRTGRERRDLSANEQLLNSMMEESDAIIEKREMKKFRTKDYEKSKGPSSVKELPMALALKPQAASRPKRKEKLNISTSDILSPGRTDAREKEVSLVEENRLYEDSEDGREARMSKERIEPFIRRSKELPKHRKEASQDSHAPLHKTKPARKASQEDLLQPSHDKKQANLVKKEYSNVKSRFLDENQSKDLNEARRTKPQTLVPKLKTVLDELKQQKPTLEAELRRLAKQKREKQNSRSPVYDRLFEDSIERENTFKEKLNLLDRHENNKWHDMVQGEKGVLCSSS